jgi:hypothetical protein
MLAKRQDLIDFLDLDTSGTSLEVLKTLEEKTRIDLSLIKKK